MPILFATSVDHPERARFVELVQDISSGNALQEAQDILIRCGAVSYCVDQLLQRDRAVQAILSKTPLPNRAAVDTLLEAAIAPVWKLCETLGISAEVFSTIAEAHYQE